MKIEIGRVRLVTGMYNCYWIPKVWRLCELYTCYVFLRFRLIIKDIEKCQ